MPSSPHIVVVDDDDSVREAIVDHLRSAGYAVTPARDGRALDAILLSQPAQLIILDIMMPGEDGLSICRRFAQGPSAILIVSALGETIDRVVGLEIGAADYLAKPFDPRELTARVRAILRRPHQFDPAGPKPRFAFEGWVLCLADKELYAPSGARVRLTARQRLLLQVFLERPGRVLSRDTLLQLTAAGSDEPFDRAIDLLVSRLRRALTREGGGRLIETVRSEGYRLTAQVTRLSP